MVLGAVEEISMTVSCNVGDDGCIPSGDWQCPNCQDKEDLSKPLIQFRRRQSVASQKETTVKKKNDLDSTDILEGEKSSCCNADEGKRSPFSSKTKELLVYKRSRFRGARGDSDNITSNLKASVGCGQVPDGTNVPVSTCALTDNNDKRLLSSEGKENDVTEGVAADKKCTLKKLQRSKVQIQLNDIATSYFRKERLFMLRARQKERIALRYANMSTKHQYVVPLHGAATPVPMNMQLVTPNKLLLTGPSDPNQGYSGSCSQQTPITPSGDCLQHFPLKFCAGSSQNDSQSRKHQSVVPLHGAATPRPMNMQLVTPNKLLLTGPSDPNQVYSGSCSQQTPITPSGNCLQLFPLGSSQNNSQGDAWVDLELDSLWIGVRRHGVGNWESMIKDPRLRFCPSRKPKDLLERWRVEKLKAVCEGPCPLPEGQLVERTCGTSNKWCSTLQMNKTGSGYLKRKRQDMLLGGKFLLSTNVMDEFANGKKNTRRCKRKLKHSIKEGSREKEVSSEGTISD